MRDKNIGYEIGAEVWFKGNKFTVTTAPYLLHGGWFQDAKHKGGKVVTLRAKNDKEPGRSTN